MSSHELAVHDELSDLQRMGRLFAASGYFQEVKDLAQACVKIQAGKELGFPPITSMTGVYIVKGRVSLSAQLMASALIRSGYRYRVLTLDNNGCEIEIFDKTGESLGKSSFTAKDANQAGLSSGDNWKKYPRNMYFARAISNAVRFYAPDALGGPPVYTPEELGAEVDAQGAPLHETRPIQSGDRADDLMARITASDEAGAPPQQKLDMSKGQVLPAVKDESHWDDVAQKAQARLKQLQDQQAGKFVPPTVPETTE